MPPDLFRRAALLLALAAASRAFVAAAPGPIVAARQTQDQPPVVVTVEFRALAGDGTPILDLKPPDVSLKVGGRLREILALEVMRPAAAGRPAPDALEQPPAPFVTNAVAPGAREVVLLLDEEGVGAGREKPVIDALGQFVAALSPADRVALVTTRTGVRVQAAAGRRDRLATALAGLTGRATRVESAADAACRTQLNIASLGQVLDGADRSVPTVVLFVSNGLVSPSPMRSISRGTGTDVPTCEVTSADLDDLGGKALASRAQIYAVQVMDEAAPAGVVGAGGRSAAATGEGADLTAGFEHVAGLTGNSIVRLIGDTGAAMKRIAAETSAYYVAAFEVPAAERNGSRQRIEVSVARQGAAVRAQPAIVIEKPGTGKPSKATKPKARGIVALSRPIRDLPLRAAAHLSRGAGGGGKLSVVVLFEPTDPATSLTEAAVGLFDERGTARTQWAAQSGALKGRPVVAALPAPPPGIYRLRVAAVDAGGAAGTIDDQVNVEATQPGAVWVGGLAFGVSANNAFEPRLQFTDEPVAVTIVEVFGAPKNATVETKFEMAGSDTAPAVATLPGKMLASSDTLRGAFVAFPIAQMPAGDVVVRAVVTVDGQAVAARPVRTFRKAAR